MMRVDAPQPRERPIGVFDSGVGGLTVLHELLVNLPHEDFLYLGDTARFPYGERAPSQLQGFSLHIARELLDRRGELIVAGRAFGAGPAPGGVDGRLRAGGG